MTSVESPTLMQLNTKGALCLFSMYPQQNRKHLCKDKNLFLALTEWLLYQDLIKAVTPLLFSFPWLHTLSRHCSSCQAKLYLDSTHHRAKPLWLLLLSTLEQRLLLRTSSQGKLWLLHSVRFCSEIKSELYNSNEPVLHCLVKYVVLAGDRDFLWGK